MEPGTWAEWAAAAGTVIAAGTALYIATKQRRDAIKDATIEAERREREQRMRDLDETRRELYVALIYTYAAAPMTPHQAGTIYHSLTHHSRVRSASEAYELCRGLTDPRPGDHAEVRRIIGELCDLRGDPRPEWPDDL